jgi:site-specific DNA-adenine methylase
MKDGNMEDIVPQLIGSYEQSIEMVESLIGRAYQVSDSFRKGFTSYEQKREQLTVDLRETLARKRSLRKKDFDVVMATIVADFVEKKKQIELEEQVLRKQIEDYLRVQKELVQSLKKKLDELTQNGENFKDLEAMASHMHITIQQRGDELYRELGKFQSRLTVFQKEQEELNHRLQWLNMQGEVPSMAELRNLQH